MAQTLVEWKGKLLKCYNIDDGEFHLVTYDPESASICKQPCPLCCNDLVSPADGIESKNIASSPCSNVVVSLLSSTTIQLTPSDKHTTCAGGITSFECDTYLCFCVYAGNTLTIDVTSYVPPGGTGALCSELWIDGVLFIQHCSSLLPGDPCGSSLILNNSANVSTPGLHCLKLRYYSGGDVWGIHNYIFYEFTCAV